MLCHPAAHKPSLPWPKVETSGNPLAPILRGAMNEYENGPNFYYETLLNTINRNETMGLENPFIIIDTNHDNSGKQYMDQNSLFVKLAES